MGSNGQQVAVFLPSGTGKVRFSGTNQDNQPRLFDTTAVNAALGPNPENILIAVAGVNWWWKGHMDIWYNDSAGNTHHIAQNIPVSYSDDTFRFAVPGVDPNGVTSAYGFTPAKLAAQEPQIGAQTPSGPEQVN